MLKQTYKKLKGENANSMVENVVILPIIFIVIYFMILMSFVLHDRSTLEAAAKRGTIYAARCISDPNYTVILQKSGHTKGVLDTDVGELTSDSFAAVGNNIKPYRYIKLNSSDIKSATQDEVYNSIQKTKIPWRTVKTGDIVVDIDNKVIYQNVKVSITASYPLPKVFQALGLPTEYKYTVESLTAVNDPDEFIRNVDLIIDTCVTIDEKTGGHIGGITKKLSDLGTKLRDFLKVKK